MPLPNNTRFQPSTDKSKWLEEKHLNVEKQSETSTIKRREVTPKIALASGKSETISISRRSLNSISKIRRIHELVGLYRHKYKANLSDAKIMANLHAAASVIQIHFRYFERLREAQRGESALLRASGRQSSEKPSSSLKKSEDSKPIHFTFGGKPAEASEKKRTASVQDQKLKQILSQTKKEKRTESAQAKKVKQLSLNIEEIERTHQKKQEQ